MKTFIQTTILSLCAMSAFAAPKTTTETIVYKDKSTITAEVQKKRFLEGPFTAKLPGGISVSGDYIPMDGSQVTGEIRYSSGDYIKGLFSLRNSLLPMLSLKKSDTDWSIVLCDVEEFQLKGAGAIFLGKRDDTGKYNITAEFTRGGIEQIVFSADRVIFREGESLFPSATIDEHYVGSQMSKRDGTTVLQTRNGSTFTGNIDVSAYFSKISIAGNGICKYRDGGMFSGSFSKEQFLLPQLGVLTYFDGTVVDNRDKKKSFWENLSSGDVANLWAQWPLSSIDKLRSEDSRVWEAKQAEERRIAEQKRIEKMRADSTALAEKRKEETKQREIEKKRKTLISKYGLKYGTMIFNKELDMGMTRAMVRASIGEPTSISQYNMGGVRCERWTYGGMSVLIFGYIPVCVSITFVGDTIIELSDDRKSAASNLFWGF